MSVLIFCIAYYLLTCASLSQLFPKMGIPSSKAWIPVVNFLEWGRKMGQKDRSTWWIVVPIVNFFTYSSMCVDLVRSFGKMSWWDSFLSVVASPYKFWQLAKDGNATFEEGIVPAEQAYKKQLKAAVEAKDKRTLEKLAKSKFAKSTIREWGEAIIFAVFAASFIRMFLFEMYVIPTSSMEGSLRVGDYLAVSKLSYGLRTPQTVLQLPLLHNRLPFNAGESYLRSPSFGYHRWFGSPETNLKRNEPFVFNYPEGDSVYCYPGGFFMGREMAPRNWSVYDIRRNPGLANLLNGLELNIRPVDKRDHYIKRCVGIAGDTIELRNGQLYVNGQQAAHAPGVRFQYKITSPTPLTQAQFDNIGTNINELAPEGLRQPSAIVLGAFSKEEIEKVKGFAPGITVELAPQIDSVYDPQRMFPHDPAHFNKWNVDNYGPLWIPKKGAQVTLTPDNIALYRRIISVYEGNKLEETGGKFVINGQATTTYTFQQNYYWAMGDNRHNSEDSRFWGFVPEDHVMGKPLFIWFSTKNGNIGKGINWSRMFTGALKM